MLRQFLLLSPVRPSSTSFPQPDIRNTMSGTLAATANVGHIMFSNRRLRSAALINLLFVLLLWFVHSYVAERTLFGLLLTQPAQWPFVIPTALLLVLTAAKRERWALLLTISAAVVAVFAILGLRLGHPGPAPGRTTGLRVMTFNIQAELGGPAAVAQAVQAQRPDVFCLQEAGHSIRKEGLSATVRKALKGYRIVSDGQMAIGSRLPIEAFGSHPMPFNAERRPILECRVRLRNQTVRVLNVHVLAVGWDAYQRHRSYFSIPDMRQAVAERNAQVNAVLSTAGAGQDLVVLCGDFNTSPRGLLYQRITRNMTDAFAATGRGLGYTDPSCIPQRRVDFVFCRGLRPVRAFVPQTIASDHRAVVADLIF